MEHDNRIWVSNAHLMGINLNPSRRVFLILIVVHFIVLVLPVFIYNVISRTVPSTPHIPILPVRANTHTKYNILQPSSAPLVRSPNPSLGIHMPPTTTSIDSSPRAQHTSSDPYHCFTQP
ncbi:hypothetical protein BDQ12DRAFT_727003 [Crucibulum laeve]|uniref:Transmembrane protein n=1 Tax=Crucibulum laeve TaxID=68775 RepID=A0A5C3LMF5_9AGAR|nr:hypothetical protein BDQ12DRAFT_727003 [Crucibulum laeve]